jgi:uncharacterized protein (TIGR00369 family)
MSWAKDVSGLSGLEVLRAAIAGRLPAPSMATTLGFGLTEAGEGWAVFEGDTSDRVLQPFGMVHGGWALTLIDSVCACAGHTTLPAGVAYTTLETKVNFVRAITPQTGHVRAEGRVLAQGRTIITADGRLTDAGGKLLAHGTSTLLVLGSEGKSS